VASPSATRLRLVRDQLLRLHKTLLDAERAAYERRYGRVGSSGEWLQLVLGHEHFAWLRPMSGLIVRIDDWIARADATSREATALLAEADEITHVDEHEGKGRLAALLDSSPEARVALAETREAIDQAEAGPNR
jgi:hypothetical protein